MENKNKIILFGGSFNPPTNAHFALAEAMYDCENVSFVLFMPVGDNYYKNDMVHSNLRYEMLNSVIKNNPKFRLSDIEIKSITKLSTFETLNILTSIYPDSDINFVMGSDNLKELSNWFNSEELLKTFGVYVLERNSDSINSIVENDILLNKYKSNIKKLGGIEIPISSTLVRDRLSKSMSVRYLVPDSVIDIINNNNLYK